MPHSVRIIDVAAVLIVGAGATLMVDAWNDILKRVLGVPSLSYCLLGRWAAHMRRGVFRHRAIGAAEPMAFECAIGWTMHYGIGVALAGGVLLRGAPRWVWSPPAMPPPVSGRPTVGPPLFFF